MRTALGSSKILSAVAVTSSNHFGSRLPPSSSTPETASGVSTASVAEGHTYFVGELGAWVHNGACPDLTALRNAAIEPHKGGPLTKAGRALQKHGEGSRSNESPFPKATGNDVAKSAQGDFQVTDILTSPDGVVTPLGRGGVEIRVPGGRGARWNADGSFSGFVD